MEWISVKDKLPDEDVRVLSWGGHYGYKINYIILFDPETLWACTMDNDQERVTHWMPLPEPPEDKND